MKSTRGVTFKSTGQNVVRLSKEEIKEIERQKEKTARRQQQARKQRFSKDR